MTASRTASDLVYEAASKIGRVVANETLGDVEFEVIDKCIDPVLEEVTSFCYVSDRDNIPLRYFDALAWLVAIRANSKFSGQPADVETVIKYEARLRYLAAEDSTNEPVRALYF